MNDVDDNQGIIPEANFTTYPNIILDNLDSFDGYELKVVSLIIRKNRGFNGNKTPNKKFSKTYIAKKTGISKPTAISAIDSLIEKRVIKCIGTDNNGICLYDLNYESSLKLSEARKIKLRGKRGLPVNAVDGKRDLPGGVNAVDPQVVNPVYPLKETISKTNQSKRNQEAEPQNSLSLTSIYKDFYTWLREEHSIIESIHLNDSRELNKFMFQSTFPPEINEAEILFDTLKVLVDKNKRIQKFKKYSDIERYFGKKMAAEAISIPNSFTIQVLLRFSRLIESCEEALPKEKVIPKKNPGELSTLEKQKRQAEYESRPKQEDLFWKSALENAKKEAI